MTTKRHCFGRYYIVHISEEKIHTSNKLLQQLLYQTVFSSSQLTYSAKSLFKSDPQGLWCVRWIGGRDICGN
jgi:hypothetical protein